MSPEVAEASNAARAPRQGKPTGAHATKTTMFVTPRTSTGIDLDASCVS